MAKGHKHFQQYTTHRYKVYVEKNIETKNWNDHFLRSLDSHDNCFSALLFSFPPGRENYLAREKPSVEVS